MNKQTMIKKNLYALTLAGLVLTSTGCTNTNDSKLSEIPYYYNTLDEYTKYAIKNGEAVKLYESEKVYLLYNNEYKVEKYIYLDYGDSHMEIYDLKDEQLLVYSDNLFDEHYNSNYYQYLCDNYYQVHLSNVSDYVENEETKEFYSMEEIEDLENQISSGLRKINESKKLVKVK